MSKHAAVNSIHLNYLKPLIKWRILDVENLKKESAINSSRHNFYRILRQLQKKNMLEGFKDPFSKKKYLYLTADGEASLSLDDSSTSVSPSTILHDLKVTEFCLQMIEKGWVKRSFLEHELMARSASRNISKINPDAAFEGEVRERKFRMAFELELTRKAKQRIEVKAEHYAHSDYYDYVMYMFGQQSLAESYMDTILRKVGSEKIRKFMFFYNPQLTTPQWHFEDPLGFFKGEKIRMSKLFDGN